jgi:peroxiredoxin family protein
MTIKSNGAVNVNTLPNISTLLERIDSLEARVRELEESPAMEVEDKLSMVVFSGDLDKTIAAFIIATGAAAMGMEVSMFFTFWGIAAVKKNKVYDGKNLMEKGFTAMMPGNTQQMGLSQLNFFGMGAKIIRKLMKDHNVTSLEDFVEMAQEFEVRMTVCDMSRELLGIKEEELIDGLEVGGVATFMGDASVSKATLFI